MSVYANKREFIKADKFETECRKQFKKVFGDEPNSDLVNLNNVVGDNYIKRAGDKNLDKAFEVYQESSEILRELTNESSIDFLLSLLDIGDIHMERKEYDKAKGFYTHCLLYTSPSPQDKRQSRMPSSA